MQVTSSFKIWLENQAMISGRLLKGVTCDTCICKEKVANVKQAQ